MPVQRLDETGLQRHLGANRFDALRVQHRGGQNGGKGTVYEQVFAAHRIARLARKLIESGQDAEVQWQSLAFVDDIIVRRDDQHCFKGYQLKNKDAASWDQSIVSDFSAQHGIAQAEGYQDIRLRLVCSNADAGARRNRPPQAIEAYSKSIHFPYTEPILACLETNPWLAQDFGYLSKYPNPKRLDCAQVAQLLIGAWLVRMPVTLVSQVIEQARDVSPTLIRPLRTDDDARAMFSPDLTHILNAIPNFQYQVAHGFLHWSANNGLDRGVLSWDCFTAIFSRWQQKIVGLRPTSFEQIEGELI